MGNILSTIRTCVRHAMALMFIVTMVGAPVAGFATENPWDKDFEVENNTSSTSAMANEVGKSGLGVLQILFAVGVGGVVIVIIIISGIMFSKGDVAKGMYGIGSIFVIAILIALAQNYIFA